MNGFLNNAIYLVRRMRYEDSQKSGTFRGGRRGASVYGRHACRCVRPGGKQRFWQRFLCGIRLPQGIPGKSPASPLSLDMREPATSEKAETLEELNGYSGPSLKLAEGGFAEWSFNLPEDTLCHVEISCCQVTGRGANAEFALYINGEIPFSSAAGFEVRRIYKDDVEGGAFQQDSQGNDIIPSVREYPVWQDIRLTDPRGYEQEPYLFRFPAGKNTLRIALNREGLAIRSIRLSAADEIPAYAEVQREYERLGYRPASDYCQTVQGELPLYKNSKSILPKADRSSPTTTPGGGAGNSLNYIGADNWKSPGASITWEIEVKQDGLYKILIKSRQKYSRDVNATRQLLIDGNCPFRKPPPWPSRIPRTGRITRSAGRKILSCFI